MRLIPLGSGSRGNAAYAEFGNFRILIDAGLSARQLKLRLEAVGVDPRRIDAILLTHEHSDHAKGAERFSKQFSVPLVCSAETLRAMDLSPGHLAGWQPLADQGVLDLGPVRVDSFPVPHDAARPVGFVIEGEGVRLGVATDLGHATTIVVERLRGCQVLLLESNHDTMMLRDGPYPWHLKQRVSSRTGHLSNDEASALLRDIVDSDCRAVVLGHLSEKNNAPGLARDCAARALQRAGNRRAVMRIAQARHPTPAIEI